MYQIIESITNLDVKLLEQTDMPKSVKRTLSMATVIPIFQISAWCPGKKYPLVQPNAIPLMK